MTPGEAQRLLEAVSAGWVDDPDSDVEWAGAHEGRWGVRMAQRVRDYTTVWFEVGDETLGYEAYMVPAPPHGREEVYRQCLVRNAGPWRIHFALDREGAIYLKGRLPLDRLDEAELDAVLGAIYDAVESAFRGIIRVGFTREKKP